ILRADEPLFQRPEADAPRRGTAALGARLPLFEVTLGSGCNGRWLSVGPMAWVCERVVRLSAQPPLAAEVQTPTPAAGLPHRHHFVGPDGSLGYRDLASAEQGAPTPSSSPSLSSPSARSDSARRGIRSASRLTRSGCPCATCSRHSRRCSEARKHRR